MSTFKFHSSVNEVVPWQAQYTFPSQQTAIKKHVVKLPPKNGGTFTATQTMRIEFPSDNYLNVLNSVLAFDLTILNNTPPVVQDTVGAAVASQATQVTLGSAAAATANLYNGYTLTLYDSTGQANSFTIAAYSVGKIATLDREVPYDLQSSTKYDVRAPLRLQQGGAHNLIKRIRVMYGSLVLEDIQEYKTLTRLLFNMGVAPQYMNSSGSIVDGTFGGRFNEEESEYTTAYAQATTSLAQTRTFALNLNTGLMSCKKLIPLKWMASQLALEITLAQDADAFMLARNVATLGNPQMQLTNVNFIAELVEFDSTYDAAFYQGLVTSGVPIKFSSWHYHNFSMSGATNVAQIHERSRSVKMALAVVRDSQPYSLLNDSDRFYHDIGATTASGVLSNPGVGAINNYWWRIGGMYYPSQPVRCNNGGAEAFAELQKCTDSLGDYTRGGNIDLIGWSSYSTDSANPGIVGGRGDKFIVSGYFENTDVSPDGIAGINAEEQSDLSLSIQASAAAVSKRLDVFVAYDCMMIVRDNNTVDLVL